MHSRWNFLDRQPRIRIRIVCLLEGPTCGQFKGCAFAGHHIFTTHVSHDKTNTFSRLFRSISPRRIQTRFSRVEFRQKSPLNKRIQLFRKGRLQSATPRFFEQHATARNIKGTRVLNHQLIVPGCHASQPMKMHGGARHCHCDMLCDLREALQPL